MKQVKPGILKSNKPKTHLKLRTFWLLLGFILCLSGCNYLSTPAATFTPVPATLTSNPVTITPFSDLQPSGTPFNPNPTATQTPTITPSPIPSPTPTSPYPIPPTTPRPKYHITVEFDYGSHNLEVDQTIRYPNLTGVTLEEIPLIVDPNTRPGIFTLQSLKVSGETYDNGYELEGTLLTLSLDNPLPPNQDLEINLIYNLDLPLRAGSLGYTNRETLLLDWYPFIPPYQTGEGWLANEPWPHGEYLAYDLADFEVSLGVTNAPETLVIAAGVPGREIDRRFEYSLPAARSFAWSASPEYQVNTLERAGVTLVSHTYKEHAEAGQAALQTAADALTVYGELFSVYPRPYFSIVEAEFADGLEYDGLIFVSRNYHAEYSGTPQDFLILLVAHEVAHQWWYGLIGNDQAGEPWLDEAFATYSEALFYERYYPDLVSWWWQFRVNYFRPEGWVNWRIYDTGRFTVYFHAVYLRGALFFRDLRALVGDEVFFDFLKNYNRGLAYRQATAADFFHYLAELNNAEVGPLVAAYFEAEDKPAP